MIKEEMILLTIYARIPRYLGLKERETKKEIEFKKTMTGENEKIYHEKKPKSLSRMTKTDFYKNV